MIIDVVDAAKKNSFGKVWEIKKSTNRAKDPEPVINDAVAKIMASFPPGAEVLGFEFKNYLNLIFSSDLSMVTIHNMDRN